MVHEMLRTEDKVIPWIASSKSSDQKVKSERKKHDLKHDLNFDLKYFTAVTIH